MPKAPFHDSNKRLTVGFYADEDGVEHWTTSKNAAHHGWTHVSLNEPVEDLPEDGAGTVQADPAETRK